MIARIWREVTPAAKADEDERYLGESGVREYRRTTGNSGVFVFQRIIGSRADFVRVSLWDSLDSIRAFAGDDLERARCILRDREFLLEFEANVAHCDVLATPEPM